MSDMTSRKPSAKAKQLKRFKSQLGDLNHAFASETHRSEKLSKKRESALRHRSCESKNRYGTKADAMQAIKRCADYGTTGLHCYRCTYCNGWHLTSKPDKI